MAAIDSYTKFIAEQARRSQGVQDLKETEASSDVSDDVKNGVMSKQVKVAFNSHIRKHLATSKRVVSHETRVSATPRQISISHERGDNITSQTIKDNAKVHDHYLAGAVDFFKQQLGAEPIVRNAMPFVSKGAKRGTRMKEYGAWPVTTHVTAILHPETKEHLMTVVAQHGGPYAKVSNTWSKDSGHYYEKLGPNGPQEIWGQ